MKGGIAAMLFAAERAIATMNHFNGELILTATVDEEIGGFRGLKFLLDEGMRADMAIVCEPTNLQISNVYKGLFWVKLTTRGKEVHGSKPERGINAISMMAKIVLGLADFSNVFSSRDILGKPTLNIGTISGGTRPNVVPPICEIELNVRFLPGQNIEMMLDRINEVIEKTRHNAPDINCEISPIIRERMALEIKKDEPIIQLIREATKKVTGRYPEFRGMASPGDVEHLVKAGIPAVMFGPGDHQAHAANEWIEIDQIVKAMEIYTRVIIDFLS
jgi:acetylornithine deacetylase/succinyl-diaminopimelate desuccinylase-like protein